MLDIILKYIYKNSTKVMVKSRAIQTQPKPDNLAKPLDANPIPTRTEGPVGRWWVSVLKNRHQWVEWRVYTYKTRAT